MERFPPIPQEQWTPAQRDTAAAIAAGPRGQLRGPFVALLYSPHLAERVQKLGEYLRFETRFSDCLLELGILVTARHNECANIWHSHHALALKAGLDRTIIAAIAVRQRPTTMADDETAIYNFCDALNRDKTLDDATFDAVAARWGHDGAVDLIATCGYYVMLAFVLNSARFALPDGAQPFAP